MIRFTFFPNNVVLLVLFVTVKQLIICSNPPSNTRNCVLESKHGYLLKIDSSGNVGTIHLNQTSADGEAFLFFLFFTVLVVR